MHQLEFLNGPVDFKLIRGSGPVCIFGHYITTVHQKKSKIDIRQAPHRLVNPSQETEDDLDRFYKIVEEGHLPMMIYYRKVQKKYERMIANTTEILPGRKNHRGQNTPKQFPR